MKKFAHITIMAFATVAIVGCAGSSSPQTSAVDCVLAGGNSVTQGGRHVACVADDSEGGKCRAKGGNPRYDQRGNFEECIVSNIDVGKEIVDHFNKALEDVGREMME